jgi:hypothetical protein
MMVQQNPTINYLRLTKAVLLVCTVLVVAVVAQGQRIKERFDPDGAFWIYGKPPSGFEDFSGINLNSKRSRRLPAAGVDLTTGTKLRFQNLMVKQVKLTFTTATVRGVSFTFSGRFLRGGTFASADLDEKTPVLEGTLTKFKDGRQVAAAKLKFTYFGGT